MSSSSTPGFFEAIKSNISYQNMPDVKFINFKEEVIAEAPVFVDYIFEKIRLANFLKQDNVLLLPISIKRTFNKIVTDYDGIIKDKLLALFFVTYSNVSGCMELLEAGISECSSKDYRQVLLDLKRTSEVGISYFSFSLPSSNGGIVDKNNLKDKIVIVDYWYTGCGNCINLHTAMKPIREFYRNNPNVMFVSVNIDKDKQKWLKSVHSGQYTDAEDLNLNTDGLGSQHPLIQNYQITSYPTVHILKDGKLMNPSPPYPNGNLTNGGSYEFVKMINKLLE